METGIFRYLSHPQVSIDPAIPVPDWGLSPIGRSRVEAIKTAPILRGTRLVVSSAERKALETASILAEVLDLEISVRAGSHENDRSATGFLPPEEFETVATQFFSAPDVSIRGWERAVDAQRRIVKEAEAAMRSCANGDVLMVGHGGVGTLLYCHYAGQPISRSCDQPPGGGGNFWSMSMGTRTMHHGWTAMEALMSQHDS
jgi:broad specificity phosphatase PhoE